MSSEGDFEVVRDPLWNNIRLDGEALELLDSEPLQRLRYIRQLGHAFLVYPGATHTRFEHALGTYHLARRVLSLLAERSELEAIPPEQIRLTRIAALLHDVGHYPFSHALEEAGLPSHESLASVHLDSPSVAPVLRAMGSGAAGRVRELILGSSESQLRGLISGSLDLDKIEYLTRDARMCGVPYGTVDVDRLLHSITLVDTGARLDVGIHEKGLAALESLLFAKYQMYRNVYWHHAVRSATCMFKRAVRQSIARGDLSTDWISFTTDESLMGRLRDLDLPIALRLKQRRLYKRALDVEGSGVPSAVAASLQVPEELERIEDSVAQQVGLKPGELLIDLPSKPAMLAADIPVLKRNGDVVRLEESDGEIRFGIREVADELNATARRLRVFATKRCSITPEFVMDTAAAVASG